MLPSSSDASSGEAQWVLGLVRLVEVVLEPGKRTCQPLATPAGVSRLRCAPMLAKPAWGAGGLTPLYGTQLEWLDRSVG